MEENTTMTTQETTDTLQPTADSGVQETAAGEEESTQKQERTFTQEELNAILQKRLAEEQDKARREADRKAAMTLAEREQELAAREAEFKRLKQTDEAAKILVGKGMSGELAPFLDYTDEITLQDSMNNLERIFKASVQTGVEGRFKAIGYTPRMGGIGSPSFDKSDRNQKKGFSPDDFVGVDPDDAFENALRK